LRWVCFSAVFVLLRHARSMISIGDLSLSLSLSLFGLGFSSLVFGDWGYIRSCEISAGVDLIVSDHCIFYQTDFFLGSC